MAYLQTNQFQKFERLNGKRSIAFLFEKGQSFYSSPLKFTIVQPVEPQDFCLKMVFTVSKKSFPLAVHRNKIKRLMREVYRNNKHALIYQLLERKKKLHMACIFTGKELPTIKVVEKQFVLGLKKIINELDTVA